MLAGILLGPAALGLLPGEPVQHLFTPDARTALSGLAQIGLVCYVFGVAHELDLAVIRRHAHATGLVAAAALGAPLLAGLPLAWLLTKHQATAGGPALAWSFGIALSVTAVPVLARILDDLGLTASTPGHISLSAAALGDAVRVAARNSARPTDRRRAAIAWACSSATAEKSTPMSLAPVRRATSMP